MKISKETAQELLDLYKAGQNTCYWEGFPVRFELIQSELVDTSRWSHIYEVIYKDMDTGLFYSSSYRTGATECQDESPYEYDDNEIELTEVVPVEKTITTYEVKK